MEVVAHLLPQLFIKLVRVVVVMGLSVSDEVKHLILNYNTNSQMELSASFQEWILTVACGVNGRPCFLIYYSVL